MKSILEYITERLFDVDKDYTLNYGDGNEIFPGIIMNLKNDRIVLILKQEECWISGSQWNELIGILKSEKINSINIVADKEPTLYIDLNNCGVLEGYKIQICSNVSVQLINKNGKCSIKNLYLKCVATSPLQYILMEYPQIIFDIKDNNSIVFINSSLQSYYVKCKYERLPNIKNTETDINQLRMCFSKNSQIIKTLEREYSTYSSDAVNNYILNDWDLPDLQGIQIFFNEKTNHVGAKLNKITPIDHRKPGIYWEYEIMY